MMCHIANVSRSGYYSYKKRLLGLSSKSLQDKFDFLSIKAAYDYKSIHKGAKQIKMRLERDFGICMNLKKIRRIMRKFDLICPIRKANPVKSILRSQQSNKTYSNVLNRYFRQGTAKKTLLTDISYIQYGSGKRAYISTIKDSSTKMILAWQISTSLDLSFVIKTVHLLLDMYKGELDLNVILHSDQGSHYTSIPYQTLLKENGIRQSMSRRGNCWDNAPQESFYAILKTELNLQEIKTYEGLVERLIEYINYFNYDRPQWTLHRMTPYEYDCYLTNRIRNNPLLPTILYENYQNA
jgi:putative transposase